MKTPPASLRTITRTSPRAARLLLSTSLRATLFALVATVANAASYYVDPAVGNMSNAGTSSAPWSTLEAVFHAGKTFASGDTIYLRNGYHGAPLVRGHNSGLVYIKPQSGQSPELKTLNTANASNWNISGLDISPANAGTTLTNSIYLVRIQNTCSNITIEDCRINSVADSVDVSQWSVADWSQAANAILVEGAHSEVIGNSIDNVNFGIRVNATATGSLITGNVIKNFSKDGMVGLADNCEFSYNTVMNSYLGPTVDANHDDGFQSWATNPAGVVSNVTLRGNVIINWSDPNQPHKGDMQGIGCFDGMYSGWIVENNMVVSNMTTAFAFLGATDCRFINNTVVKNTVDSPTPGLQIPQLKVEPHKNGTPSTGNVIRNNLITARNFTGTYTADHNITTVNYAPYFVDYSNLDLRLKAGSRAIDAGSTAQAPSIDCDQNVRSAPYDVGCFEYQPGGGAAHTGTWSMQSTLGSTATYSNLSQKPTGITSNSNYVASLWIKGSGSVRLTVRAGSWGATLATLQCDATSTWTKLTTPAFSTGSNTQLTIVLQDQYGTAGTVYVDDMFLGQSGGTNMLTNPGFENGNTSWTITNSAVWNATQSGPAVVPDDPWSLKTVMGSTPTYSNASQKPIGIAANTTYVASLWIKGSGSVELKVMAGSWGTALTSIRCDATSTWTKVTTPAFNTGSNTQLTIAVTDRYGTAGTVYVDDMFIGVSGGDNVLLNPGFEDGATQDWWLSNTIWSIGQF